MTGIMIWLDTTQTIFTVAAIAIVGIIALVVCGVITVTTTREYFGEHYIEKVTLYDDENLLHASTARVMCACGFVIRYTASGFEDSDRCEREALKMFKDHQQDEEGANA